MSFLDDMAAASRARAQAARDVLPEVALRERLRGLPRPPPLRLSAGGFDLIAELKLRSPAIGRLRDAAAADVVARVTRYARAGAAAVSVLTEPSRFDGALAHLESASRALAPLGVPAMRKDFLVEPYQVLEARLAGAGGVLVILRMLPRAETEALLDTALDHGMFALLEAFDEADIELAHRLLEPRVGRAQQRERLLVGVNCRDLLTLQVVPGRLEALAPSLPAQVARVAESGVTTAEDAARMAAAGYQLALVGSALMQCGDADLAGAMIAAGRAARCPA